MRQPSSAHSFGCTDSWPGGLDSLSHASLAHFEQPTSQRASRVKASASTPGLGVEQRGVPEAGWCSLQARRVRQLGGRSTSAPQEQRRRTLHVSVPSSACPARVEQSSDLRRSGLTQHLRSGRRLSISDHAVSGQPVRPLHPAAAAHLDVWLSTRMPSAGARQSTAGTLSTCATHAACRCAPASEPPVYQQRS